MTKPSRAEEIINYVDDIRRALIKTVGDEDFAGLIEALLHDVKRLAQILMDEGLAEERDFHSISFDE